MLGKYPDLNMFNMGSHNFNRCVIMNQGSTDQGIPVCISSKTGRQAHWGYIMSS